MSSGSPAWLSSMHRWNHKRSDLARIFCKLAPTVRKLSGALRPPRMLRIAPVDRLQQITHLGRRQRHNPVHRHRPDKTSTVQPLGVERQPNSIVPYGLNQCSAASAEHEDVASERITAKAFLHQ